MTPTFEEIGVLTLNANAATDHTADEQHEQHEEEGDDDEHNALHSDSVAECSIEERQS